MCGRYRTPDEQEICPGASAEILCRDGKRSLYWGIKLSNGPLLINARSETADKKPLFHQAMRKGRCIIAASAFYEWDTKKHCHAFTPQDGGTVYMAALIVPSSDGEDRFVVLTQPARGDAQHVHPRMPCLLPNAEYRHLWLHDDALAPHLLTEDIPLNIRRIQPEREQLDFFTS